MKDLNTLMLSGRIFWSKLDDKGSYSILSLGIDIGDNGNVFCRIGSPSEKTYDIVKSGNKVLVSNSWLDTWFKDNDQCDTQIKTYGSYVGFYKKETVISNINSLTLLGTVLEYEGDTVLINMTGERNPKTEQYTQRKAHVIIGDTYTDIINKKILLKGKVRSVDTGNGKTKMVAEAIYDTINIL